MYCYNLAGTETVSVFRGRQVQQCKVLTEDAGGEAQQQPQAAESRL